MCSRKLNANYSTALTHLAILLHPTMGMHVYCTNMLIFHFVRGGIRYFYRKVGAQKKHAPQTTESTILYVLLFISMQILFFCCDWAPRMICNGIKRTSFPQQILCARSLIKDCWSFRRHWANICSHQRHERAADECHNASLAKCISAASKPNARAHIQRRMDDHIYPEFLYPYAIGLGRILEAHAEFNKKPLNPQKLQITITLHFSQV